MLEVVKNVVIFLVALPIEILYLTTSICCVKGIKEKRVLFYVLLLITGILYSLIMRWQLWYYLAYISSIFLIMKILYKSHISDLFVFMIFFAWIAITSYIAILIAGRSIIGFIIQRILMFSIFALRGKFKKWYKSYRELWNRRDDNRIKSITLRNISLIFLNAFIVFMNFILIFLQNFSK